MAVQVVVKFMDDAENNAEHNAEHTVSQEDQALALDLVRTSLQLLADACFNCPQNCDHVFALHSVRIIHDLIIRFKINPAITKVRRKRILQQYQNEKLNTIVVFLHSCFVLALLFCSCTLVLFLHCSPGHLLLGHQSLPQRHATAKSHWQWDFDRFGGKFENISAHF